MTQSGAGGALVAFPHILVVEDELIGALDLTRRLTRRGYAVTRAASGAAAVEAADPRPPGLVLMDVYLAGETTGVEAAATIWPTRRSSPP